MHKQLHWKTQEQITKKNNHNEHEKNFYEKKLSSEKFERNKSTSNEHNTKRYKSNETFNFFENERKKIVVGVKDSPAVKICNTVIQLLTRFKNWPFIDFNWQI